MRISRQAFYAARHRRRIRHALQAPLLEAIRAVRRRMPRIGGRKLLYLLRPLIPFGRDGFFAFLKRHRLLIRRRERTTPTTYARGRSRNQLRNRRITAPEQVLVADLTYLRLPHQRFCYAALLTDAYSRAILGYAVSDSLAVEGCLLALRRALRGMAHPSGIIHHSDRGFQYASSAYRALLERHGITSSMTEHNHCYENALAERVNGILKHELGLKAVFPSLQAARKATKEAIHTYNTYRPHLALDYKTPRQQHLGLPKKPVNLFRT